MRILVRGIYTQAKAKFLQKLSKETGYRLLKEPFEECPSIKKNRDYFTSLIDLIHYNEQFNQPVGILTASLEDLWKVHARSFLPDYQYDIAEKLFQHTGKPYAEPNLLIFLTYTPQELLDQVNKSVFKIYPKKVTPNQATRLCIYQQNIIAHTMEEPSLGEKLVIRLSNGQFQWNHDQKKIMDAALN